MQNVIFCNINYSIFHLLVGGNEKSVRPPEKRTQPGRVVGKLLRFYVFQGGWGTAREQGVLEDREQPLAHDHNARSPAHVAGSCGKRGEVHEANPIHVAKQRLHGPGKKKLSHKYRITRI